MVARQTTLFSKESPAVLMERRRQTTPKNYYYTAPTGNNLLRETAINAYCYFCLVYNSAKNTSLPKHLLYQAACAVLRNVHGTQLTNFIEFCHTTIQYSNKFKWFVPVGENHFSLSEEAKSVFGTAVVPLKEARAKRPKQAEMEMKLQTLEDKLSGLLEQVHKLQQESPLECNTIELEQLQQQQQHTEHQQQKVREVYRNLILSQQRSQRCRDKKRAKGLKTCEWIHKKAGRPIIFTNVAAITAEVAQRYSSEIAAQERRRNHTIHVPGTRAEVIRQVQEVFASHQGPVPSASAIFRKGFIAPNKKT
jgi:hypothetical protein